MIGKDVEESMSKEWGNITLAFHVFLMLPHKILFGKTMNWNKRALYDEHYINLSSYLP